MSGRILKVGVVLFFVSLTWILLGYALESLETTVAFTSLQRAAATLLVLAAASLFWWWLFGVFERDPKRKTAAMVSLIASTALSIGTAALPWLSRFQSKTADAVWSSLTVPTTWLQQSLEHILGRAGISAYSYPWHLHFEFGGVWRAIWLHSLVAIPFWFVVFMLVWLAFRAALGVGHRGAVHSSAA